MASLEHAKTVNQALQKKANLESQNANLMFRNGVDTSVKANQENG